MTVKSPKILDCTLRDGGYYTSWDFSQDLVDTYLTSIAKLPIDIVEIGYINLPRNGYFGQYYFLTPGAAARVKDRLRPDQKLAVMIDEKAVPLDDINRLASGLVGHAEIVRMAVAPTRLAEAAALGRRLKLLGFQVGVNIMYLSKYWDSVSALAGLTSAAETADYLSLVDSYGGCTPDQVSTAIEALQAAIPSARIGFHGHDNLRLAFANSLSAIEAGAEVIDTTVTGMGRGPGNTQTETMLIHAFAPQPEQLDYVALHSLVEPFEEMQRAYGWGTNLVYMISGAAGLPQNKVMDWLGKNRYSVPSIIHALRNESVGAHDETVYESLSPVERDDLEVIVIGGGSSVEENREAIVSYANANGAVVVHANYRHLDLITSLTSTQHVALAGDVLERLPDRAILEGSDGFVVSAAPRVQPAPEALGKPTRQVDPFVATESARSLGPVSDIGPLSLALGSALALGASRVTLIGFDGYDRATVAQQELAKESQQLLDDFRRAYPHIDVSSATASRFDLPVVSIYSRLAALEIGD